MDSPDQSFYCEASEDTGAVLKLSLGNVYIQCAHCTTYALRERFNGIRYVIVTFVVMIIFYLSFSLF